MANSKIQKVGATGGLTFTQVTTPADPGTGLTSLYAKSDGVYYLPTGGSETLIGTVGSPRAESIDVRSVTGNITLTPGTDKMVQWCTSDANRDCVLATVGSVAGDKFVISERTGWTLTIKQSTTTLDTSKDGAIKEFIFDGTNWKGRVVGTGLAGSSSNNITIGALATSNSGGIAIGVSTTATVANSVAIGNTARCGSKAGVAIGYNTLIDYADSVAIGNSAQAGTDNISTSVGTSSSSWGGSIAIGESAKASNYYSMALGRNAVVAREGEIAITCKYNDNTTTNQYLKNWFRFAGQTTDGTATELATMGDSTTRKMTVLATSAITFEGTAIARCTADNDCKAWTFAGTIQRDGSNNTALIDAITPTVRSATAGAADWTIAITADDTNEALLVTVTGKTSKTVRWVAVLDCVEVRNSV